jgi:hypothetical protein
VLEGKYNRKKNSVWWTFLVLMKKSLFMNNAVISLPTGDIGLVNLRKVNEQMW